MIKVYVHTSGNAATAASSGTQRYDWINNNKPSIGVIAQDIEKVLPEVVETNSNGLKSVSYGNIVGVLIEAIKEQQVRIEELERKLNA